MTASSIPRACGLLLALALALGVSASLRARADEPPLPPPRPPELGAPEKAPEAPPVRAPAPKGDAASACLAKLVADGASAETAPAPVTSVEGCGINAPVRLSSITVEGDAVSLPDRPLVACEFALALADYVRLIVAPLGQAILHAKVGGIETGPGYTCRTQDHIAGARSAPTLRVWRSISLRLHSRTSVGCWSSGRPARTKPLTFGRCGRRLAAGSRLSLVRAPTCFTPTTCTSTSNPMARAAATASANNFSREASVQFLRKES